MEFSQKDMECLQLEEDVLGSNALRQIAEENILDLLASDSITTLINTLWKTNKPYLEPLLIMSGLYKYFISWKDINNQHKITNLNNKHIEKFTSPPKPSPKHVTFLDTEQSNISNNEDINLINSFPEETTNN